MKIALTLPGMNGTPIDTGLPVPTGGLDTTGISIIQTFVTLIVVMAIIFAIWNFWRGGLDMMKSRGNKESFKKGRERILLTALGLGFLFLTFALVGVLKSLLGVNMFPYLFPDPR
jgi:hypothetical protein